MPLPTWFSREKDAPALAYIPKEESSVVFGIVDSAIAINNITEALKTRKKATLVYCSSRPLSVFPTLTCLATGLDEVLAQSCLSFTTHSTNWELNDTRRALQKRIHEHDCQKIYCGSWLEAAAIGLNALEDHLHEGQEHTLVLTSLSLQLTVISIQYNEVSDAFSDSQMRWNLLMLLELSERVAGFILDSKAQCIIEAAEGDDGSLQIQSNLQLRGKVESTIRHITSF